MLAAVLEENKSVARQWFDQVWNHKNEAAIDRLYDQDGKCYGFPKADSVLEGREAFKAVHRDFCGAFPDLQLKIEDLIAEGDKVAIQWHVTATHTGDDLGFPASHRQATLAGSSVLRTDGKTISEGWNFMDLTSFFQKLQAS